MATATHGREEVDIDPGWYPGQPETADEEEPSQQQDAAGICTPVRGGCGERRQASAGSASVGPGTALVSVPSVLSKLQKWGDYSSVGAPVFPTRFVPMKTPLSTEILTNWSLPTQPKHRLTVPEMVAEQAAQGRKIGLLLDLSNHDCLYTDDIPPDVQYIHIQLVAKELPSQDFVDAVVSAANKFWTHHPDLYIAVHCAYGFNRTGFIVASYLVEVCGLSVDDALASFADSRPPGVKHEAFRAELHARYSASHTAGAVAGSPDNSSFGGYSPSCRSLDLLGMGPSPLSRNGAGLEGMLGMGPDSGGAGSVGSFMAMAGGRGYSSSGGGSAFSPQGGGSIVQGCSSLAGMGPGRGGGHQTLTFTTGSCPSIKLGAGEHQQQQQQRAHVQQLLSQLKHSLPDGTDEPDGPQQEHQHPGGANEHAYAHAWGRGVTARMPIAPGGVDRLHEQQSGQRGPDAAMATSTMVVASAFSTSAAVVSVSAAAAARRRSSEDHAARTSSGALPGRNENESLGFNDRYILQTMKQHALAQQAAAAATTNGTGQGANVNGRPNVSIPEEATSEQCSPVRGISSESLNDCTEACGGVAAGHNITPLRSAAQTGRFSRKSLDSIDWAADTFDAGEEQQRQDGGGAAAAASAADMAQHINGLRLQ